MPCNSVVYSTINLKSINVQRLKEVLEAWGYSVYENANSLQFGGNRYDKISGKLVTTSASLGQQIVELYALKTVKEKASKWGFKVKQTSTKNRYLLQK